MAQMTNYWSAKINGAAAVSIALGEVLGHRRCNNPFLESVARGHCVDAGRKLRDVLIGCGARQGSFLKLA